MWILLLRRAHSLPGLDSREKSDPGPVQVAAQQKGQLPLLFQEALGRVRFGRHFRRSLRRRRSSALLGGQNRGQSGKARVTVWVFFFAKCTRILLLHRRDTHKTAGLDGRITTRVYAFVKKTILLFFCFLSSFVFCLFLFFLLRCSKTFLKWMSMMEVFVGLKLQSVLVPIFILSIKKFVH